MATEKEAKVVYAAGLVQGIVLVTFPAASTIFTDPGQYDLSNTQYGTMFLPQVAIRRPKRRYQRTAMTITSGGKRKPAKAERGTGVERDWRVLMPAASLSWRGRSEYNSAVDRMWPDVAAPVTSLEGRGQAGRRGSLLAI
jgi:hypothetical protein